MLSPLTQNECHNKREREFCTGDWVEVTAPCGDWIERKAQFKMVALDTKVVYFKLMLCQT